jgi:hypothetical protein
MRYPGGKFRCFQKLINLIPPHRVYIETHLGGGAVLRNKIPAELTIGIDRDPAVIQAFTGQFKSSHRFIVGTAEQFLKRYHFKGDEFIYADPPYWPASRRSRRSPYRYAYSPSEQIPSKLRWVNGRSFHNSCAGGFQFRRVEAHVRFNELVKRPTSCRRTLLPSVSAQRISDQDFPGSHCMHERRTVNYREGVKILRCFFEVASASN